MIESSSLVELEEFEQIEAAPGTALLRIAARTSGSSASGAPSTLMIDDGRRLHRVSRLPAPQDPPGVLRAAYPVALELLQSRPKFLLEFPDGSSIELPSPSRRRRAVRRESPAPRTSSPQTREAELESQVAQHQRRATQLQEELADAREEASGAAQQSSTRIEELRAAVDVAIAEAAQHRERSAQLQNELAAAFDAVQAEADHASELEGLRAEAEGRVSGLQREGAECSLRMAARIAELEAAREAAAGLAAGQLERVSALERSARWERPPRDP